MICEFRKNDETMQMREVSVEWVCMTRKKLDSRGEVARGSERKKGYNLKFEMRLNGVRSFVGGITKSPQAVVTTSMHAKKNMYEPFKNRADDNDDTQLMNAEPTRPGQAHVGWRNMTTRSAWRCGVKCRRTGKAKRSPSDEAWTEGCWGI